MNLYTDHVVMDFEKINGGLVPAIIQDSKSEKVLMLGYMNADALDKTRSEGKVTFFSRSKERLWTKGENSGNFLNVDEILFDCDRDTLLIKATPAGPICHTGSDTCFGETNTNDNFLFTLEDTIRDRYTDPKPDSYTSRLFDKGIDKIAQKVGEEAVELVIEAKNSNDEAFRAEAADLVYHLLVLLVKKGVELRSVISELKERSR